MNAREKFQADLRAMNVESLNRLYAYLICSKFFDQVAFDLVAAELRSRMIKPDTGADQ